MGRQEYMQADRLTGRQTRGREVDRQAHRIAGGQAGNLTNRQAGGQIG